MSDSTDGDYKKPPITRRELENVKQSLQRAPLAGTQIMVPATTKAFFSGTLQPTITNGKEQVLVKMVGDNLVELECSEAVTYLDRRMEMLEGTTQPPQVASATETFSQEEASEPTLPFFEIREELDESGNEVKAEAINVAKQLEYLQSKSKGKTPANTSGTSFVPTASSTPMNYNSEDNDDHDQEQLKPMTDQEYDALSNRLDMLARLEEEAESKKIENQASAKKLQSKGWSKGFLNAKPKKKKMTQIKKQPELSSSSTTNEGKRVGFQATNDVREIPRVGTRSASELKPPTSQQQSRKEIETQVFSGVVRERSIGSINAPVEDSPSTKPPPKKKLSRFAQERLAEQQQQQER